MVNLLKEWFFLTNKEKYYDKIMDYIMAGADIAVDKNTGKLMSCFTMACSRCKFNKKGISCPEEKLKWLNEEYIEPETDWSKVEVDTPILVKNKEDESWKVRYFAKYKNRKVWCWDDGKTSYSVYDLRYNPLIDWKYAKLLTPAELEQYRRKI